MNTQRKSKNRNHGPQSPATEGTKITGKTNPAQNASADAASGTTRWIRIWFFIYYAFSCNLFRAANAQKNGSQEIGCFTTMPQSILPNLFNTSWPSTWSLKFSTHPIPHTWYRGFFSLPQAKIIFNRKKIWNGRCSQRKQQRSWTAFQRRTFSSASSIGRIARTSVWNHEENFEGKNQWLK